MDSVSRIFRVYYSFEFKSYINIGRFFKKIICLILKKVLVRIGFVYYSNHTYVSRSVDIICYRNYYNCCLKSDCNSINYFTFWACSKYVKTRENWLITIVAFVVYGVGTYMYIQFAFRGY